MTNTAVTLANNNQQYSQKNNIKFTKWQECPNENHRSDLCKILKETVNVDLDAAEYIGHPQSARRRNQGTPTRHREIP